MDAWLKRKGDLKLVSIEIMIKWFKDREGKVTYSQANRLGPNSYDCSSAVFFALIEGGFLPKSTNIGNTESLYGLENSLLIPISRSEVKRGDLFVSGFKGASGGNDGHTGVFLDNTNIIHCTPAGGSAGIITTPATNWMGDYKGLPVYYYRLKNADDGNIPNQESEEKLMWVFYQANKNVPVRWFNGEHAYAIGHADEMKAIQQIYKANTGKDVPFLTNWTDATPYHNRLANVLNRKPDF